MEMENEYDLIFRAMVESDIQALERYSEVVEGFPQGKDQVTEDYWIINAVDSGTLEVVEWMIQRGVAIDVVNDEGYTVLFSAIDREDAQKYAIMRALIEAGARVNEQGRHTMDTYSAAHLAAIRDDIEALKILIEYGADLSIKTEMDNNANVLEEAKAVGSTQDMIEYLEREMRSRN